MKSASIGRSRFPHAHLLFATDRHRQRPGALLRDFLDDIPDGAFDKLFTPGAQPGTLHRDRDFRLDWQRNTSDALHFNVQVQINKETEEAALKRWTRRSVTLTLIPVENVWSADEIRAQIRANFLVS
ncbi:MAG: hypothetical protein M1826_004569 [Phylliscum demangeonii]|nr:MAG: hypothetical protein M1826_004569 [Phylliscum demangeonii]